MSNIKRENISELKTHQVENTATDYPNNLFFSDWDIASECNKLKKIIIQSYLFVDGIEFIYDDDISTGMPGNSSGNASEFSLNDTEYIESVLWETGCDYYGGSCSKGVVIYIEFKTNKGTVFHSSDSGRNNPDWTNKKSFSYKAPDSEEICGISGYSGSNTEWLYSITKIYIKDIHSTYTANEKYYNDYYSIYNCRRLAKIKIYHGWLIDKLQFVYTNEDGILDEAITEVHGNGNGSLSEIQLSEEKYIEKIIYKLANTNFCDEKAMYYLEFIIKNSNTGREQSYRFGDIPCYETDEWEHDRTYIIDAPAGYELFALSGYYCNFMGNIEAVYYRELNSIDPKPPNSPKRMLRASASPSPTPINTSNAYILFINCTEIYDANVKGNRKLDDTINIVYKNWNQWRIQSKKDLNNYYSDAIEILTGSKVTNDIVQKAIFSGQYRYISIKAHGQRESVVGPEFSTFFSAKMVRDKYSTDPIGTKNMLKNTIFNFFCCECAYRKDGLAATLVKYGAKACYGYTVPLSFLHTISDDYTSFVSYIDNAILMGNQNGPQC